MRLLKPEVERDLFGDALAARLVGHWRSGQTRFAPVVIVGGFGAGKTHFLDAVVENARATRGSRSGRLAKIGVAATSIATYDDLLYELVRSLAGSTGHAVDERASALRAAGDRAGLVGLVSELVMGQPLVLCVDDLDLAFREFSAADRAEIAAMATSGALGQADVALLASVGRGFEVPDSFERFDLLPLGADEVVELLNSARPGGVKQVISLAELLADQRSGGVALDAATVGNPRFWTVVASYLDADRPQAVSRAFRVWSEMLSIHYPERLRSLAPSERRIVVELARAGRPTTVGAIAQLVGMSNPSAASALGRLFAAGWVTRVEPAEGADRRSTWYELTDDLLRQFLRRREQTGASAFVVSSARQWRQPSEPLATQEAPIESHLERMGEAEALGLATRERDATDVLRQVMLDDVQTIGLTGQYAVEAMGEWGRWIGEAGERSQAVRILNLASRDADLILGVDSVVGLQIKSHLAWNQIQSHSYRPAGETLQAIQEHARRIGDSATEARLGARQNEAIVVGELGDPDGAVEIFREVLQGRIAWSPQDLRAQRQCRHGLAYWTAQAGRPAEAIQMFLQLSAEEHSNQAERMGYVIDRIGVERGMAEGDEHAQRAVVAAYLECAAEARLVARESRVEHDARRNALDLATRAFAPSEWPVVDVTASDFALIVSRELFAGRLAFQGLTAVVDNASEEQLASLATTVVFTRDALEPAQRAQAARILGSRTKAAYGPLLKGLAAAIEGDAAARSSLPKEWLPVVELGESE